MLPFLNKKPIAGLIIAKRKPDGGKEEIAEATNEHQELEMHMESLMRALNAKDSKAAAEAFAAAIECCQQEEPQPEGPQSDEEIE